LVAIYQGYLNNDQSQSIIDISDIFWDILGILWIKPGQFVIGISFELSWRPMVIVYIIGPRSVGNPPRPILQNPSNPIGDVLEMCRGPLTRAIWPGSIELDWRAEVQ
jgi:hypothetical protein